MVEAYLLPLKTSSNQVLSTHAEDLLSPIAGPVPSEAVDSLLGGFWPVLSNWMDYIAPKRIKYGVWKAVRHLGMNKRLEK